MSFTVGPVDPQVDLRLDGDAGRTVAPGSSGRVEQMGEQEGGECGVSDPGRRGCADPASMQMERRPNVAVVDWAELDPRRVKEHSVPPCLVLVINDNLCRLMVALSYI